MKLLDTETPVTRNFIPQILLNEQDFYFHKVGYTSYDEGIFGPQTDHTYNLPPALTVRKYVFYLWVLYNSQCK
jgi:hypothetical protein